MENPFTGSYVKGWIILRLQWICTITEWKRDIGCSSFHLLDHWIPEVKAPKDHTACAIVCFLRCINGKLLPYHRGRLCTFSRELAFHDVRKDFRNELVIVWSRQAHIYTISIFLCVQIWLNLLEMNTVNARSSIASHAHCNQSFPAKYKYVEPIMSLCINFRSLNSRITHLNYHIARFSQSKPKKLAQCPREYQFRSITKKNHEKMGNQMVV